jgi:hypothetical protein
MMKEHSQLGDVSRIGRRKATFLQRLKGGRLDNMEKEMLGKKAEKKRRSSKER